DSEFERGRPLSREVSGLPSTEYSAGVDAGLTIRIRQVDSVAHKPARDSKLSQQIHCGNRMVRRERDDLIAVCYQERIDANKERAHAVSGHGRECCFYLSFGTSPQDNELEPKRTCSRFHISHLFLGARKVRVHKYGNHSGTGNEFVQQSELL